MTQNGGKSNQIQYKSLFKCTADPEKVTNAVKLIIKFHPWYIFGWNSVIKLELNRIKWHEFDRIISNQIWFEPIKLIENVLKLNSDGLITVVLILI